MIRDLLWDFKTSPFSNAVSLLGFVIGVFSVVFMGALGIVEERRMVFEMDKMGADRIVVVPKDVVEYPFRPQFSGVETTLKPEDAVYIKKRLINVKYVAPTVFTSVVVRRGNVAASSTLIGSFNDYLRIMNFKPIMGSLFKDSERSFVCVLGYTVYKKLFGKGNPVGKVINISDVSYRVIGVLGKKGVDASGQDQDDMVFAPVRNVLDLFLNREWVSVIYVVPKNPAGMKRLILNLEKLLTKRHGRKDFDIRSMVDFVERKVKVSHIARKSTLASSFIALIVGGIGIMSLMIIKGRERVREIGIKRAVGARRRDIFFEFFTQSAALSIFGGASGFVLGILASFLMLSPKSGGHIPIPWGMGLVSLGISVLTGTLFGLYPALKASRVSVVEAVTQE